MDEETIPQNNNLQANKQGQPTNNETVQSIQESNNPITNNNSKSEPTNTIKTTKRKKIWIIIVIIASILAIVGGGIAIAYNNGLFGDDEDCMCAAPPGVKQCRNCNPNVFYKPIIYLYPKEVTNISVKLGYPELITADYPSYNYGWNVTAYPDGNLKIDDRNYYALYYESQNKIIFDKNDTGFVVESNRIASFLEDKLSILGLNEKESEEFIIYWLPKLQSNNYVYIRFATEDEISKNMPLDINPKPDTTIRVLMIYKGLNETEPVIEQNLTKAERAGYAAIEWGGTEAK